MTDASPCLFCRIVRGEIPATIVAQREGVTAFRDIAPRAPTHILIVPNEHIAGAASVGPEHDLIVGTMIRIAAELARQEGVAESGYRLTVNQGVDGGQSVPHLHVHLMGGRRLRIDMG